MVAALHIPVPLNVSEYLRSSIRYYLNRLLVVPWQAASILPQLTPNIAVVLIGEDPLSVKAHNNIVRFMARNQFNAPIVEANALEGAADLGVSIVPQIRVYARGVEVRRHHGLANYAILSDLFAPLMY